MSEQKLKVGVIGVGRMGQFHANCYSEIPDVDLIGVADLNAENGKAVAERFGVTFFADYKELLQKVDVVSIAVPTILHYEVAKDVLTAGVHALVEKPVTNNYEQARHLFDIAAEKKLVLHVGHVERFNGAVRELKSLIENPLLIQSRRMGPFQPRVAADGVVLDLMIHDIDIILNMVKEEVVDINVMGSVVFSDRDDIVVVQLRFASGVLATVTASRATQNKVRNMTVTCREKYLKLDFADQEINVHRMAASQHQLRGTSEGAGKQELRYSEEETRERIFVHRDNPLKLELQHLINCVLGRENRYVSVDSELKSLKVALEILKKFNAQKGS